jgi:DNA-binding NarL/FixJ family response regulator
MSVGRCSGRRVYPLVAGTDRSCHHPSLRGVRTRARLSRAMSVRLTSTGAVDWPMAQRSNAICKMDSVIPRSSPRAAEPGRPPIRVVVADDSYLVRVALKHLFEGIESIVVVGECEDANSVVPIVDESRADLLITDIRMPPSGQDEGIRLAAGLRKSHPALSVIVLSTYAEVTYALKLLEAGSDSRGYLLKDRIRDRQQVIEAVTTVADGGLVIDPTVVDELVKGRVGGQSSALAELTPRELETLALVAEGRSNADIAEVLVLTKRAVEKHVNAIFAKLELGDPEHVSRRVKAALLYLAERDVHPGPTRR